MRLRAIVFLLLAILGGCAHSTYVETPDAVQSAGDGNVPHIDRTGRLRESYDPAQSFFPIGIYHALTGRYAGRNYELSTLAAQGFNTVHPWEGLDLRDFVPKARAAGLQVLPNAAVRPEAPTLAADPAILAWYLEEEPASRAGDAAARRREFERRSSEFSAIDGKRAQLVVETSLTLPPLRSAFDAWVRSADIFGLTVYPIVENAGSAGRRMSISYPRGIPETIAAARSANAPSRPVWLFVQAFASPMHMPRQQWLMPTPSELRAMIYAGLIHGATGIFIFAQDSFVTRAGDVVGIGPDIPESYDPAYPDLSEGRPPLAATSAERAAARELWNRLPALASEIRALSPGLLGPGPALEYRVAVSGAPASGTPIRTLLKRFPDGDAVLMAVNVEARPVAARYEFGRSLARVARMFDDVPPPKRVGGAFYDTFEPFGVRVYRLEIQP